MKQSIGLSRLATLLVLASISQVATHNPWQAHHVNSVPSTPSLTV